MVEQARLDLPKSESGEEAEDEQQEDEEETPGGDQEAGGGEERQKEEALQIRERNAPAMTTTMGIDPETMLRQPGEKAPRTILLVEHGETPLKR